MTSEVIDHLARQPEGRYIDATFGRGGHTKALLAQLKPGGRLLAFDCDAEAIQAGQADPDLQQALQSGQLCLVHSRFSHIGSIVESLGWMGKVNGILFDLGVSSPQLDNPERGFSFQQEGPLSMLMDASLSGEVQSAADWINTAPEKTIADVLYRYGDERYSRRIASAIVEYRASQAITTTTELARIIALALPKKLAYKKRHPATRSFQAIRIFINKELDELEQGLGQLLRVLAEGGVAVVITFHSLEARLFKAFTQPSIVYTDPKTTSTYRLKRLGSAIKASREEVLANPRSRCAMLRVACKIKTTHR